METTKASKCIYGGVDGCYCFQGKAGWKSNGQSRSDCSRAEQPGLQGSIGYVDLCPTECASFWMTVLTDMKSRGVEDILITSTDNLKGFTDAITSVYPHTRTQIYI